MILTLFISRDLALENKNLKISRKQNWFETCYVILAA
jgi:hypothetical protein